MKLGNQCINSIVHKLLRKSLIIMYILMLQTPVLCQTIEKGNWYDAVQSEEEEYEGLIEILMASDEIINEILIRLNLVDLEVEYDGDQINVGWRIMWQNQKSRE